jgi:hypothetical protein
MFGGQEGWEDVYCDQRKSNEVYDRQQARVTVRSNDSIHHCLPMTQPNSRLHYPKSSVEMLALEIPEWNICHKRESKCQLKANITTKADSNKLANRT